MLVKIVDFVFLKQDIDFGKSFRESRFWSKFTKMTIFVKIYKSLNFSQILKHLDFGQNFRKSWVWSIFSKNLDLD